jgi:hypothetical protein
MLARDVGANSPNVPTPATIIAHKKNVLALGDPYGCTLPAFHLTFETRATPPA